MWQPYAYTASSAGFGTALRGYGLVVRTMQSVGIEWLDHAKQSRDDIAAAAQDMMTAPTPAAAAAIQIGCAWALSERFMARAATCSGLLAALAADLGGQGHGQAYGRRPGGPPCRPEPRDRARPAPARRTSSRSRLAESAHGL